MSFHRLNIIDFLDQWKPRILGNVLDIGAGTWEYPRKTLREQCNYMTVDQFEHPNIDFISDIHHLDQLSEPATWDYILCFDVLEHVQQPSEVILQAWKLLKSGGTFLVTTPYLYPLHSNVQTKDYWRISPEAMQFLLLEIAGFTQVDIQTKGNLKFPFSILASAVK